MLDAGWAPTSHPHAFARARGVTGQLVIPNFQLGAKKCLFAPRFSKNTPFFTLITGHPMNFFRSSALGSLVHQRRRSSSLLTTRGSLISQQVMRCFRTRCLVDPDLSVVLLSAFFFAALNICVDCMFGLNMCKMRDMYVIMHANNTW